RFVKKNLPENVHLLVNEHNLGYSGGNNVGIRQALAENSDYVLILNNDTKVDKNFLVELLESLHQNENAGVAAPKIYFEKGHEFHKSRYKKDDLGKVIWYAGGIMDWQNLIGHHRGVDEVDKGQFDKEEKTELMTGCCLLIKSEALKKIGLFKEDYFLYYEDADFSMRLKNAGYTITYSPKALVWHKNAESSGSGSPLQDYFITRNRLLFGIQYAPLRTKVALLRESVHLLKTGREWQKLGVKDYFSRRFGKGSYK